MNVTQLIRDIGRVISLGRDRLFNGAIEWIEEFRLRAGLLIPEDDAQYD